MWKNVNVRENGNILGSKGDCCMNTKKDGNRIIMLLGLAGFMVMAENWVVSPILPAISQNLEIDISRAGL